MGIAVTCVNRQSFEMAIGHNKPRQIPKAQSCIAASGDKMSSLGIFEINLRVKGKKFGHAVIVINELKHNIIGIDIIHVYKLMYAVNTRQM